MPFWKNAHLILKIPQISLMSIEQIKIWIKAARLRTLPLSISGIVAGNALGVQDSNFSWLLFF
jgi:1,4-dihydroxy-2-naphthoate octaprenyltransferase